MSVKINGLDDIMNKFNTIDDFHRWAERPMKETIDIGHDYIATYPPARAESTYRRTGTLGRRWTSVIQKTSNAIKGVIGNVTEYAEWVQSDEKQVWYHALGKWRTDKQMAEWLQPKADNIWQAAINKLLSR